MHFSHSHPSYPVACELKMPGERTSPAIRQTHPFGKRFPLGRPICPCRQSGGGGALQAKRALPLISSVKFFMFVFIPLQLELLLSGQKSNFDRVHPFCYTRLNLLFIDCSHCANQRQGRPRISPQRCWSAIAPRQTADSFGAAVCHTRSDGDTKSTVKEDPRQEDTGQSRVYTLL
jgi:hypothetical protein